MDFLKNTLRVELWLRPVFLILLMCFCVPTNSDAQYKYDYEWLIGYNADWWDEPRFAINKISFHSNPPDTIRTELFGSTGGSATLSMANSRGNLIFYSNGCSLFDHEGDLIYGGENLVEGQMFETHCFNVEDHNNAYRSWVQSMLSIPMDNNDSLFIFINHRYEWTHNTDFMSPFPFVAFDLQISHILRNTNGEYNLIKKSIIVDTLIASGGIAAIRDTKPNYWWLFVPPAEHLNNYRIIRLGPEGLDTIYTFFVNFNALKLEDKLKFNGTTEVSPLGNLIAQWMPGDTVGTLLLDFDRTNGKLSNVRHLPHPERDNFVSQISSGGGGAAISPSGRFLYVNTRNNLYQYDLEADDIAGSIVHIAEYDGFRDTAFPNLNLETSFFMQQLGPDCRIYMSSTNAVSWLHVINYPDRKGKACDFRQHSFKLPGNHSFGLPYHPNYRLGTGYPVCDSTLTSTTWFVPEESGPALHLYPNPAREYAVVGWSKMEPEEIAIYDLSGRELYRSRMQPGQPEYYLDLSGYSAGVYLVRVRDRSGVVRVERLVVGY